MTCTFSSVRYREIKAGKLKDMKVQQEFNEAGVTNYIRKERLLCVGDDYEDPKLEVDDDDDLDIEEGKRRKGKVSIDDMKVIIEKQFEEGEITNKDSMAKKIYEKGMCIPYTNHKYGIFSEYEGHARS